MNENTTLPKKGFIVWLSSLFHKEPKNRDELVELIRDSEQNSLIDPDTREMLEGVMDVAEQRVRDIMIPRSQIITLKNKQTLDECLDVIMDSSHSRYPVINEDKDHVDGILMAKDLLIFMRKNNSQPFNLEDILRPAIIVPESKRVDQMLKEFRSQRYHMAIIVDEFGGVSGLVTIEDILELIVGDIADEYDEEEDHNIRHLAKNNYTVRAVTPIEEFNKVFATRYDEDDFDTIGGFVMQAFGHLPKKNEVITIEGYQFKATIVDSRKIIQLHIAVPDDAAEPLLV